MTLESPSTEQLTERAEHRLARTDAGIEARRADKPLEPAEPIFEVRDVGVSYGGNAGGAQHHARHRPATGSRP